MAFSFKLQDLKAEVSKEAAAERDSSEGEDAENRALVSDYFKSLVDEDDKMMYMFSDNMNIMYA